MLNTSKEITAALIVQADAMLDAKDGAATLKGNKASATDIAGRLAIAAVLAGCLAEVKDAVKEHGKERWAASKGAINGAAQFASKIKASDMALPTGDDENDFMVAGEAVTIVTRDTLDTLASHDDIAKGDTPVSRFLAVMRDKTKKRNAVAELIVNREESALVAWLIDGKAKAQAAGEVFEYQGEDATSIRQVMDAAAVAVAVSEGSALVAIHEREAAQQAAQAEIENSGRLTLANLANLSDELLANLSDGIATEVANRTAPAKDKASKAA